MSTPIFDQDYQEASRLIDSSWYSLRAVVAQAIATERERCAQIAENFNAAGKPIAAAIRAVP
jgi:hypothetical protein